ncbi:SET domain-containing protein-lysine N-methyltransferase [Plectonema radiosum NIES-515]|uniref:SET domain-containing protein-lysine N-methyltransferase n=1 Tax=Plectonema radiosum NIES-515 TaxID=2986073 RepID=A0ABT3B6A2_9CYAN|nr:SET domain-containing protein-lysine N-methyltransferase [Plectonema radiosum]MCV3216901.1 SET domain-containing protein-lysine N-methyltransferase [Plectonema radiosum NIES-515]
MKVCVLQPDYSQSTLDYKNYDPPRNLSYLLPEDQVDHVFLNKTIAYRQLKELKKQGYDIFVNLIEGYRDWDIPFSYDVATALEDLNLPYTGPKPSPYDPPKDVIKYVAESMGVKTPAFVVAETLADVENTFQNLKFPLFVKPVETGDSLGVDNKSYVTTKEELLSKAADILANFERVLIEEYIDGRELTVLIAANPDDAGSPVVYKPVEFLFPKGEHFKTYDLKHKQHHPQCYVPCDDEQLDVRLREATKLIFLAINPTGYARVDFRINGKGEVFFLEINLPCTVLCGEVSENSADYILKFDGTGLDGFLKHIIAEGIARHQRRQKKYKVRNNQISGYGIYAVKDLKSGEVIFTGEARSQKIVTRSYVESHWNAIQKEDFRRYAYPISEEVFILWDDNPTEWSPQNHSCDPNIAIQGLDYVAIRDITAGEELTLDYATLYDENFLEFDCQCGSLNCRGIIRGISGNSVTQREKKLKNSQLKIEIENSPKM